MYLCFFCSLLIIITIKLNEEHTENAQETDAIAWAVGVFFLFYFHFTNYFFSTIQWFTSNTMRHHPLSLASARWARDGRQVLFLGFPFLLSTLFR